MSKTILKTFRLPLNIAKEIELEAKKTKVSQAQYFVMIFTENKTLKIKKTFEDDLARMAQDESYKKEQQELAEANFM